MGSVFKSWGSEYFVVELVGVKAVVSVVCKNNRYPPLAFDTQIFTPYLIDL